MSPGAVLYWPYPSPPVSPTGYFAAPQAAAQTPGILLMRGIPLNVSYLDIMAFFQGFPEVRLGRICAAFEFWSYCTYWSYVRVFACLNFAYHNVEQLVSLTTVTQR